MGLLTEDLMESSELTCGSMYECTDVYTVHQGFDILGGHGCGLFAMKIGNPRKKDVCALVDDLPVISDSKGRIRIDPDALIKFACGCFNREIGDEIRKANPKVDVSSTDKEVYYVVTSDYVFPDTSYETRQILRVTTKSL